MIQLKQTDRQTAQTDRPTDKQTDIAVIGNQNALGDVDY